MAANTASADSDVIMNRLNVALARSQRLINSWLPPPATSEQTDQPSLDDDADFKPMTEAGGIGSAKAYDEEGLADGALQRKKLSSNDKLLEQIIGKKAAQAKKKSLQQSGGGLKSGASKPLPVNSETKAPARPQEERDDEEEEGRVASLGSLGSRSIPQQGPKKSGKRKRGAAQSTEIFNTESPMRNGAGNKEAPGGRGAPSKPLSDSEPDERPKKKKGGSYLDELLEQKARKKGKNK